MPAWINPWGLVAFLLAALALLLASIIGLRSLTILLAALGLVVVLVGIPLSWPRRQTRDRVWLTLGGSVSGAVLGVALFASGLLNPFWAIDFPVPRNQDPNRMVVVPRDVLQDPGKPYTAGDWVDAETEAIRQYDMIVRVDSVKTGPLPDKEDRFYLQIHLRLANSGHTENIPIECFGVDKHPPALHDDSGRLYPFLDQRPRRLAAGVIVFEPPSQEVATLLPPRYLDYLLVFELPSSGFEALKLELPASAWGRQGVCRFRIAKPFEATLPEIKTN